MKSKYDWKKNSMKHHKELPFDKVKISLDFSKPQTIHTGKKV